MCSYVAGYMIAISKNKSTELGFKADLSRSMAIVATFEMGVN